MGRSMHCTVCSQLGQISIQLTYQDDVRILITGIAIYLVLQSMFAYPNKNSLQMGDPSID